MSESGPNIILTSFKPSEALEHLQIILLVPVQLTVLVALVHLLVQALPATVPGTLPRRKSKESKTFLSYPHIFRSSRYYVN